MKTITAKPINSSYRDPCGFVFSTKEGIFRQINLLGQDNYDALLDSGLYHRLIEEELLIPHQETTAPAYLPEIAYKVIKPEPIPFVSYPYEWSFGQLKDAALLTLEIQKIALQYNLSLQDASAYNVQFHRGHPILIDTLSFEPYQEGKPWVAYRQFCQHFLAPLILAAYFHTHFGVWLQHQLDGIPIPLCSHLLPPTSYLNLTVLVHIHLHSRAIRRFTDLPSKETVIPGEPRVSKTGLLGIIDSLDTGINKLKWQPDSSEWLDYEIIHSYSPESIQSKTALIESYLDETQPKTAIDIGANTGRFSRQASKRGAYTISLDSDAAAVDRNYRQCRQDRQANILPLVMDITNPSPALGWDNQENLSFTDRSPCDVILALALLHHLAIGKNLPLERIAQTFSGMGKWLIIEFIPKDDRQVQLMLSSRQDIFASYNQTDFEYIFGKYFTIVHHNQIENSPRCLYLMRSNHIRFK